MAASDARPIPTKNVAFRVTFPLLDADGDLVTGAASLDSEVSKDGGTFADCTNEATEIATSSGMYYLDLTSTEMNADTVAIIIKSSSAKTTPIVLYPQEAGDIKVDVESISGDTTAANNAESFFDGTGYAGTNNVIPTVTTLTNAPSDSSGTTTLLSRITALIQTKAEADTAHGLLATAAKMLSYFQSALRSDVTVDPDIGGTYDDATDSQQAVRDRGDAAWVTATGFSTLDAAGVRTAVGLASANLDTQLGVIDDFLDTEISAIKVKTDNLPSDPADQSAVEAAITAATSTLATAAALDTVDNLLDTEVAAIKAVTDALGAAAAAKLALAASTMITGTVDNTAHTPTTTQFEADDITEATADHYNGLIIKWITGALAGQTTEVSDYVLTGGRGHFTVVAMTEAPANNDTFILV